MQDRGSAASTEGPCPAPLPQAPGEVWGGPWPPVGLLVRSLGGGTGKGQASPVTCLPSSTPFHLILPSSAGPALPGPRVWDHAAWLRGVSKESEITHKGPSPVLVEVSAGRREQGSGSPQGEASAEPTMWARLCSSPQTGGHPS